MTKKETLELPSIFVVEGYDSIEDEDGNMGFGVYIPRDKQIYVAGEVPYEMFVKALFHELAHWVQDVAGNEFNEDEANDFAERVYEAIRNLPSAQPEIVRCKDCKNWERQVVSINDGLGSCSFHEASFVSCDGYCYWAERREDGKTT